MEDKELNAIVTINTALTGLEKETIERVLEYVAKKFGIGTAFVHGKPVSHFAAASPHPTAPIGNEIPGIATYTDGGQFKLTVRDFKAKNTNDAAIRIALVSILAYTKLTGEQGASSKKIVNPALEKWRAYTGNTRLALASHKGIIRDSGVLSLDAHATTEAENYIKEILDDSIVGTWKPSSTPSKRKKGQTKEDSAND